MSIPSTITIHEKTVPNSGVFYTGTVVATNTSDLQSWTLLNTNNDLLLFIDDQHQSSVSDEHIYHETFVHSLLIGISSPKKVLILGGGEGCTAREVLRWPSIEYVVQVDWDKSLVDYFKTAGTIFNNKSYDDPRLTVIHEEALQWLKSTTDKFDAIFIDLLDPNESTLSFLKELLCECKKHLSPRDSGLSINAGMIQMYNNDAPACALASYMRTLFNDPNYSRAAIHVDVPSFLGSWGFLQIASPSWSRHIHDTKLPENITYCKKEVILNGTRWPTSYPLELQNFWMTTDTDSTVKLTDYFNPITGKVEHYGC